MAEGHAVQQVQGFQSSWGKGFWSEEIVRRKWITGRRETRDRMRYGRAVGDRMRNESSIGVLKVSQEH